MTKITLSSSKQTPEILLDFEACKFQIKGCSRPEDVELFYGPLIKKIDEHRTILTQNPKHLEIDIHMIYFNSSSLKFLLELLRFCVKIKGPDAIILNWIYDKDDDDVYEVGNELSEALNITFTFIEN
jgi:hypothetical protein